MMKCFSCISLIVFAWMLASCSADKATTQNKGKLLAEVDNMRIYEQDLQLVLVEMFGERQVRALDAPAKDKALKSLVTSRLMARKAKTSIDKDAIALIEIKTQNYRDNLLASEYIKQQAASGPMTVTDDVVREYYQQHAVQFGQKRIRQYQLLSSTGTLSTDERDSYLQALAQYKDVGDLKQIKEALSQQGLDMQFHRGVLEKGILSDKLYEFIKSQPLKQKSAVFIHESKIYLSYVESEVLTAPRPLSEVQDKIRKIIVMGNVKDQIKTLSEQLLKQSNVVYHK